MKVEVPNFAQRYGYTAADVEQRVREWLALSLFTEGRISSGKAAELLGISRVAFPDLLNDRGIAYFDLTEEEWAEEVATLKRLRGNAPTSTA